MDWLTGSRSQRSSGTRWVCRSRTRPWSRPRKDQFGQTLGQFVQENFLAPDVIGDELQRADIAGRLGRMLAKPENAATVAGHIAELLGKLAENARDDDAISLIEAEVRRRIGPRRRRADRRSVPRGPDRRRAPRGTAR